MVYTALICFVCCLVLILCHFAKTYINHSRCNNKLSTLFIQLKEISMKEEEFLIECNNMDRKRMRGWGCVVSHQLICLHFVHSRMVFFTLVILVWSSLVWYIIKWTMIFFFILNILLCSIYALNN